jgi:hypothetical protein
MNAPVCLLDLFDSDDDNERKCIQKQIENPFEITSLILSGTPLQIREFAFHPTNANAVWRNNTFSDFLTSPTLLETLKDKNILELGSALGSLAILLTKFGVKNIFTSDYDDTFPPLLLSTEDIERKRRKRDHNNSQEIELISDDMYNLLGKKIEISTEEQFSNNNNDFIEDNISFNFNLNGLVPPTHIRHTWGWPIPIEMQYKFDIIIANDILLYVNSYPALILSLLSFMNKKSCVLYLSWQRRMKESEQFFQLLDHFGFQTKHLGKKIYEIQI